jgi:MFS family permease
LVLYVDSILHGTTAEFGLLLAVGAGGSIVGGLLAGRIVLWLGSITTMVAVLGLAAAGQVTLGLTSSLVVAGAMSALCALAFTVWNVVGAAFRQRRVPDRLLGRVTGAYLFVAHGATAAGAIVGGVIANAYGLRAPFFLGAPLLLAVAFVLKVEAQR